MKFHYAIVKDPKVQMPKVESCIDGDEQAVCPTCGKTFNYDPLGVLSPIKTVVCSWNCITKEVCPTFEIEAPVVEETKEQVTRPVKVVKPPCSECGGLPKGRGWNHKEGCSLDKRFKPVSEAKPPCKACGGPARGRGWSHKSDCSLVVERQTVVVGNKTSKRTCPKCGGPARGRGFTHTEDCSQ